MWKHVYPVILFLLCSGVSVYGFDRKRLDSVMEKFRSQNGPCTAIILDPADGHVGYVHDREMAFGRCYPPGSIFKTLTAAVLLSLRNEYGFNPLEPVPCKGVFCPHGSTSINNGDRLLFNLTRDGETCFPCSARKGHGKVDLRSALVYSCNTYFLTAASRNPEDIYRRLIVMWHLDEKTGINAGDAGESAPMIIKPSSGFQYAASVIGEGGLIQVTPLKVTQVYASIFEGTPLLVPRDGTAGNGPVMQYPLAVPGPDLVMLRGALASNLRYGTLKGIKSSNPALVILSGKTGTASRYLKKYSNHGWTVLHLKHGSRRYVMTVFVYDGTGPGKARKLATELCDAL